LASLARAGSRAAAGRAGALGSFAPRWVSSGENLMGGGKVGGGGVLTEAMKERLSQDIKSAKVVLYMKGVPAAPQCGFSNMVIRVFDYYRMDMGAGQFKAFDVLGEPDLKEAMKEFSQWPTFPQIYVDGDLVGGCDVLLQMHEENKLGDMFTEHGIKFDGPDAQAAK